MKNLPLKTRRRIQEFVATHEDCRVVFYRSHRRTQPVYLLGTIGRSLADELLGRPRTQEAADELHGRASVMVAALERGKAVQRAKREANK